MKSEAAKVIKSIMATAALALFHSGADAAATADAAPGSGEDGRIIPDDSRRPRIDRNVYKVMRDGGTKLIAAHRSHSSHRSHRSSSGGHTRGRNTGKRTRVTPAALYTPATETDWKLGERALGQGMRGTDVDRLVAYLTRYYYLHDGDAAEADGRCVYNAAVVEAVRHFQRDAGYVPDGKCTGAMVQRLKEWDPDRTTIALGFRPLTVAGKMSGYDVDCLIDKLISAGCSPDKTKLCKQGRHYVFTDDVLTALKVFQATHGLRPTGELDEPTLKKLSSVKK